MTEAMVQAEGQNGELSAGALLQMARLNQEVSIETLANILKVPAVKIEALENNQHEVFPDMVFIRALASSVCRVLGVDNVPVLARLPQVAVPSLLSAQQASRAHFQPDKFGSRPIASQFAGRSAWSKFSLWGALVCVLAAALVFAVPDWRLPSDLVRGSVGQAQGLWMQALGGRAASSKPAEVLSTPASPSPAVAEIAPVPAVAASGVAVPAAVASDAAASSGLVEFRATSASWVEVTNARRAIVLSRLMQPGESARIAADAALPLSVVVGRSDAVQVWVRGEKYELAAVSKNNVARFVVN